jgi:tRNA-specific 2-thiouridylase
MRYSERMSSKGKGRVFVGLSGGVDSAVSAALLKAEGYEVTGAFIRIALPGYPCTAGEDKIEAMRVAAHLQIPFVETDLSEAYRKQVFELSMREFAAGRTPNPDALCNREIKFGIFFDWCIAQGAGFVATGHYAQTRNGLLYAGADGDKDQSYFLWAVTEEKLRKTLFPVGHLNKSEVRALAKKFDLPNAARKDSQGLCFLGPVTVGDMLERELPLKQGVVLDETGGTIGAHKGASLYTLGQRHGFALHNADEHDVPQYVIAKDAAHNTITVSPSRYPAHAMGTEVTLSDTNWIGGAAPGEYGARFRYRQALVPARLGESGSVTLLQPHYVPEGQSLVLYDGERCMGGGTIASSRAC